MVVGIDVHEAAPSVRPTGTGRVAAELAARLPGLMPDDEFVLYSRERFDLDGVNVRWDVVARRDPGWHRTIARRANRDAQVFLSPTSYLPPQFLRIPYALVVHDLVTRRWKFTAERKAVAIHALTLPRALRRAAAVLTPSEAVRDELMDEFPRAPRATVMHEGADERFRAYPRDEVEPVLHRYGISGEYILCTGTIEPRKNLIRTVRAYSALPEPTRARCALVLAGRLGWRSAPILREIEESPARDTIAHLSFVPDDDLPRLYAGATAFCYASLYEGFGLPVVEAMQSGTPVVTSARGSLPEVAGEAAIAVDPEDEDAIRDALEALLGDPELRRSKVEAGFAQAAKFSWERTGRTVAGVLQGIGPPTAERP